MRTTIRIDDDLLAETKQFAAQTGRSLAAVIEDSLREMLARWEKAAQRAPVRLITDSGQGLVPGTDLNNSSSLQDLMDSADGPGRR